MQERNEIIQEHQSDYQLEHPAIYVGTYGKYNSGSLGGAWLDLTSFDSYDELLDVCRLLHYQEADPEFMAQDFECFPREYYSEGFLGRDNFDRIKAYWEVCEEHGREAVDAFFTFFDDIDKFDELYYGHFDSEEDFAEHIADELGYLGQMPDSCRYYFDFSKFARDLFMGDFHYDDGYVFRAC